MSNIQILFGGSEKSKTEQHILQVYANINNEIFISIEDKNDGAFEFIALDKSTAIRLSREIRRQIALLEG